MNWHWRDLSRSPVFLRFFHWIGFLAVFPPILWFRNVKDAGFLGGIAEALAISSLILLIALMVHLKKLSFSAFMRYIRRVVSTAIFSKHRHGAPFSIYRRRR